MLPLSSSSSSSLSSSPSPSTSPSSASSSRSSLSSTVNANANVNVNVNVNDDAGSVKRVSRVTIDSARDRLSMSMSASACASDDDVNEEGENWKSSFVNALKSRNRREKDNHHVLIQAYSRLLSQYNLVSARASSLSNELTSVRSIASSAVSPSILRTSEERCMRLQEELTASYRLQSESAISSLRAREACERAEKALSAKEAEIGEIQKKCRMLEESGAAQQLRMKNAEASLEILRKELEALRIENTTLQQQNATVQDENRTLLASVLAIKEKQVGELNSMNEMTVRLLKDKDKAASGQGQSNKHQDVIDLTSTEDIIDQVAWKSNNEITVPTERKRPLRGHRGPITSVRYNSTGTLLASSGSDGLVRIWDARVSAQARYTFKCSKETIMVVGWAKDDALIVAAGNDQTARVWAVKQARLEHTLTGHSKKINAAAFAPDDHIVATGGHDRTVRLWDVRTGSCVRLVNVESACNYLSFAVHEETMATAHLDSHVRLWSPKSGEKMHDLDIHTQQVTSVEFSRDGVLLATNSRDNTIKIVDVRNYKVLQTLEGTIKDPYRNVINWSRVCFSPDGQYAIAGSLSGALFVWKVETGKIESVLHLPSADGSTSSSSSSSSSTSSSSSSSSSAVDVPETAVNCVDWNKNGRQVVTADNAGCMHFWE